MGDVDAQVLTALCFEDGEGISPSPESSIHYFTLAAENDDQYSQWHLGRCYEDGKGVEASPEKAIYYYKLAADKDHLLAQYCLGSLLKQLHRDSEAFEYFMMASNNNSSDFYKTKAQYVVGSCFENGRGVAVNVRRAVHYYQLAADAGSVKAQCRLCEAYFHGQLGLQKSYEKGLQYFIAAAESDDSGALMDLGTISLRTSSEDVKDILQKKIAILESKANQGDIAIQVVLGLYFDSEIGTEPSPEKSFYYYSLAAAQNDASAQFHLGECYLKGKGVEPSPEKALHYYRLASDQGDLMAQIRIGECFLALGRNEEAFHYFALVSQNKDNFFAGIALNSMAECFERGHGVEKSEQSALSYYQQAANQGSTTAKFRLAKAYISGELGLAPSLELAMHYYKLLEEGFPTIVRFELGKLLYEHKRYQEAFAYFKLVVEDNSVRHKVFIAEAQYYLGLMYENGEGVEKSASMAETYFQLAAEYGYAGPSDMIL
ncbi:MAG: sel1 repeat family protein [Verrucomicrobia bacterium]|nr:sel1 repeat family protein [Verrucomicrobiota bacterium]